MALVNLARMKGWAAAIVLAHLVVNIVHGMAHSRMQIGLSALGNAFVILVILIGPIAGLVLLWAGQVRKGAAIVAITMAASFLFGLCNHFVVSSADHVAHLPEGEWKSPFVVTAWLLLVTEAAGTVVGTALLRR